MGYEQYFGNIDVKFQKGYDTPEYLIVVLAGGAYAFNLKQISKDKKAGGLGAKERIDLIKEALFNFITEGRAVEGGTITPASQQ